MIDIARDNLIDLNTVARKLKVKTQTVRNWVNSGKLYAVRAGGRWYTNEQCLNAMAQRPHIQQATSSPLANSLAASDQRSIQNIHALLGQTG